QIRGSVKGVHAEGTVVAEEGFAGGVAGSLMTGSLHGSSARGSVTGDENVGGLVGSTDPDTVVSNSWSMAEVTGSTKVGGLIGSHGGRELSRSYSIATVTATHDDPFAGGLAGELNPETVVSESYSYSTVESIYNGKLTGKDWGATTEGTYWGYELPEGARDQQNAERTGLEELGTAEEVNDWELED